MSQWLMLKRFSVFANQYGAKSITVFEPVGLSPPQHQERAIPPFIQAETITYDSYVPKFPIAEVSHWESPSPAGGGVLE